jgi:hypothetical protein
VCVIVRVFFAFDPMIQKKRKSEYKYTSTLDKNSAKMIYF